MCINKILLLEKEHCTVAVLVDTPDLKVRGFLLTILKILAMWIIKSMSIFRQAGMNLIERR
ncbi:hypothetical protein CKK33_04175 [Mucilaginibacter sp. MD40]|nr:hypothetical protein CKK33_04175 [Mucilaginibacter sp. MD40]